MENNYLKDFIKAQAEMRLVEKNANNEFSNYNYSTIDGILNSIREPLNNNNFLISQQLSCEDGDQYLITEFIHTSGSKFSSKMLVDLGELDAKKNRAQCMGSMITYYRKYSLICLAGICSVDDDAECLTNRHISKDQLTRLTTEIRNDYYVLSKVLEMNKIKDLKFLDANKFDSTLAFVESFIITSKRTKEFLDEEQIKKINDLLAKDEKKDLLGKLKNSYKINHLSEIEKDRFTGVVEWLEHVYKLREQKK